MLDELDQKIVDWAEERGILDKASPKDQFVKTIEEVGELAEGISKHDMEEIIDAVGDIQVTLIILCKLYDIDYSLTKQHAYDIISQRTGKMVNGVFVKDN